MRLLLLDCDLDQNEWNTARMIVRDLMSTGVTIDTYRAFEGRFPHSLDEYNGIIINGSAANVIDEEEWIQHLFSLIREAHAATIPLLGICFGHQAIAVALGGEVEKIEPLEFGYRPITFSNHSIFSGYEPETRFFQYHSYTVSKLPSHAEELARNDRGVQSFSLGNSFGVQFHPEILPEAARGIAQRNGKSLADLEEEIPYREARPEKIFHNFLSLAQRLRSEE